MFNSSKELTLVVRSGKVQNSGYPKWFVFAMVNADHDFHPLADHMTTLRNVTEGEIREFSAFPFSLQLMFDQIVSNLIVRLMISQKLRIKVAQTSQHVE